MLLIKNLSSCSNPSTRSPAQCEIGSSRKLSFCIKDFRRFDDEISGGSDRAFPNCDTRLQGISRGWADFYDAAIPGQVIDVTSVPSGSYWVEALFDPNGQFVDASGARTESDPSNNRARGPSFSMQQRCEALPAQNSRFRCFSGIPDAECASWDCRAIGPNCCHPAIPVNERLLCARCLEAYCHLNPDFQNNPACLSTGCGDIG